jgi:hypothetical protein
MATVLGSLAITEWRVERDLDRRGEPAVGTVVEVDDDSRCFASIGAARCSTRIDVTVTYTDARGTPRRATRRGSEADRVGEAKAIVYDPIDPTHVRWGQDDNRIIPMIGIGAMCAVTGVAILLAGVWSRRRRPMPPG